MVWLPQVRRVAGDGALAEDVPPAGGVGRGEGEVVEAAHRLGGDVGGIDG